MKILCPITKVGEIDILAANGADEFFFGVLDEQCIRKSRAHLLWNRRAAPPANFPNCGEAEKAIAAAIRWGKPIYLTVNELFYSSAQIRKLRVLLKRLSMSGLSGVIVSSLEMISWIRGRLPHLKLIASTTSHILNSESVRFYETLGVSRVTIPVSATIQEVADIKKSCPGMEFECFILNESCINLNGLCLYYHGSEADHIIGCSPCKYPGQYTVVESPDNFDREKMERNLEKAIERKQQGCFCCRIPELMETGVEVFKIVGRMGSTEKKLSDLLLVRELLDAAPGNRSGAFVEYAKEQVTKRNRYCAEGRCQAYQETT